MRLLRLPPAFIFLCFLPLFSYSEPLHCYHCINQLASADITAKEKTALKRALFTRFNIPPSNEYCAAPDGTNDVLFRTVSQEECPIETDTCVKIISEGDENRKLVLRGCQSTLVRPGFDLVTNYSCHRSNSDTTSAECVTTCQEQLCNDSHGINLIPLLIALTFLAF